MLASEVNHIKLRANLTRRSSPFNRVKAVECVGDGQRLEWLLCLVVGLAARRRRRRRPRATRHGSLATAALALGALARQLLGQLWVHVAVVLFAAGNVFWLVTLQRVHIEHGA